MSWPSKLREASSLVVRCGSVSSSFQRVWHPPPHPSTPPFVSWDVDGDGTVSLSEFRQGIHALGILAPLEEIDYLFSVFDVDCSGEWPYQVLPSLPLSFSSPTSPHPPYPPLPSFLPVSLFFPRLASSAQSTPLSTPHLAPSLLSLCRRDHVQRAPSHAASQ